MDNPIKKAEAGMWGGEGGEGRREGKDVPNQ